MSLSPAEFTALVDAIATAVAAQLATRPRLVDRYDLARVLSISVPTIERLQRDGQIVPIRAGRRCLYDPDSVIASLSKSETATA